MIEARLPSSRRREEIFVFRDLSTVGWTDGLSIVSTE